jgi:FkbM family methyltransferase
MSDPRPTLDIAPGWAWVRSGVGYHLDNFSRWLVGHVPTLAASYAWFWAPRAPRLGVRPGWRFGEEYHPQQRWLARRRGALWEAARETGIRVPLSVRWHGGTTVNVTLGNDNSLCLYVCGSFEPNEFAFLDRALKPGMIFVDVGANDGYYTLFAARKLGGDGHVIAVEPSSRERAHLCRNLERNAIANVTVVPAALGAAAGTAELKLADGLHAGHNTLGDFAHNDVVAAGTERVQVETLDTIAGRLGLQRIDVMKIDVEGAEASVIAGARGVLMSMRPLLLLEVDDGALRAQRNSAQSLLATLRDELDYEILAFSAATGLLERPVDGAPLSSNIVAAPKSRAAEILNKA